MEDDGLGPGPEPMSHSSPAIFQVVKKGTPRLGKLTFSGRAPILTPHHVVPTSRGIVPHITPDNLKKHTAVTAVHVALEDFVEKWPCKPPPIFETPLPPPPPPSPSLSQPPSSSPSASRLRRFIAMHSTPLLILSARRTQPVSTAKPNGDDTVWLSTSVGFRKIKVEDFGYAVERLRPDVVLGLADGPEGFGRGREGGVGRSRVEKMVRRTDDWMGELLGRRAAAGEEKEGDGEEQLGMKGWPAVWAPVLPVETGLQSFYLDRLEDSLDALSGLAFYDAASATTLPAPLDPLVRYSLAAPKTPQDILKHLELGIDLFSIPFIAEATDAGVALQFSFGNPEDPPRDPATSSSTTTATPTAPPTRLPLGVDLWPPTHATSSLRLSPSCPCYACSTHLRAYIHHLLQAKEMLAWVLLQLHNLSVVDRFFAAVRASLRSGGGVGSWERDVRRFEGEYEAEMPVAVGRGPRVRGYQYRNEGMGEGRRNEKAFEVYEGGREDEGAGDEVQEADAEGVDEAASIPSTELAELGFAEKETP